MCAKAVNFPQEMTEKTKKWHRGKHVISQAQGECAVSSWVLAKSPFLVSLLTPTSESLLMLIQETEPPITGQIKEIIQDVSTKESFALLDVFQVSMVRHELFGMPILSCWLDKVSLVLVQSKVISPSLAKYRS